MCGKIGCSNYVAGPIVADRVAAVAVVAVVVVVVVVVVGRGGVVVVVLDVVGVEVTILFAVASFHLMLPSLPPSHPEETTQVPGLVRIDTVLSAPLGRRI